MPIPISIDEATMLERAECANSVVKSELDVLRNGRVERTFTAHFAAEIAKEIGITGIRVDPFYNKHLGATKMLGGKVIELDIAIHERDIDENNLIAIELETNNYPSKDDIWKIDKLTQKLHGFGYQLGLYIVFGVEKKAGQILSKQWFKRR